MLNAGFRNDDGLAFSRRRGRLIASVAVAVAVLLSACGSHGADSDAASSITFYEVRLAYPDSDMCFDVFPPYSVLAFGSGGEVAVDVLGDGTWDAVRRGSELVFRERDQWYALDLESDESVNVFGMTESGLRYGRLAGRSSTATDFISSVEQLGTDDAPDAEGIEVERESSGEIESLTFSMFRPRSDGGEIDVEVRPISNHASVESIDDLEDGRAAESYGSSPAIDHVGDLAVLSSGCRPAGIMFRSSADRTSCLRDVLKGQTVEEAREQEWTTCIYA